MHFSNEQPAGMNYPQQVEDYVNPDGEGFYLSSSPENHTMQFHPQGLMNQKYDYNKNARSVRKIDGPVIPMEYSDPDLQRQSSEFSAILQQATASASMKRHESTFVMDISPSVVGWIIGRSGIRIKEIQSLTGCKMWVDQDVPNDQPRKIYFHGSKQSIDAAVGRVNELVQAAPILSSNHVASGKGLTSVIVDCPVSLVGLLIGKRGWTIKKIQQASNAQISINQSVREGLPRKIIVSGDEKSVSTALRLITEVLRDKTLIGNNGEHEGHQLSMRTAGGNGYPPPFDSSSNMPMRESSPMMFEQQYNYPPQYHHGGHHQGPPHMQNASYNPVSYSNPADIVRDRHSPGLHAQYQHPQANHGYHQKRNMQQGGYNYDSNRVFSNQYGHGQQPHDVAGAMHRGSGQQYGGRHFSTSPPTSDQFADQHYQQHRQPTHDQYSKNLLRDNSPNNVEGSEQSFNSSSIFDFQHRQSAPTAELEGNRQGQGPLSVSNE